MGANSSGAAEDHGDQTAATTDERSTDALHMQDDGAARVLPVSPRQEEVKSAATTPLREATRVECAKLIAGAVDPLLRSGALPPMWPWWLDIVDAIANKSGNDAHARLCEELRISYPATPVDCLLSDLISIAEQSDDEAMYEDFVERLKQWLLEKEQFLAD